MSKKRIIKDVGIGARGRKELLKHLSGGRLTQRQAILAKCYDCMGYFTDGKEDCGIPECSLYPFMAYRPKEKDAPNTPV